MPGEHIDDYALGEVSGRGIQLYFRLGGREISAVVEPLDPDADFSDPRKVDFQIFSIVDGDTGVEIATSKKIRLAIAEILCDHYGSKDY